MTRPLIITLLILWFLFAWFIQTCFFSGCNCFGTAATTAVGATTAPAVPLTIKDGAAVIVDREQHLRFAKATPNPIIPSTTNGALNKLTQYVKNTPNKSLQLTGLYDSAENNPTNQANLGLARAEAIKTALINKGLPSNLITTLSKKDGQLTFHKDTLIGGVDFRIINTPAVAGFLVKDGDHMVASNTANLQFEQSNATPIIPAPINQDLNKVATYLKGHPDRNLSLVGYYANKEQNTTTHPNLGIARAEAMKQQLIGLGVPTQRMDTKGQAKNLITFDDKNRLTGGIDFTIFGAPTAPAFLVKDGNTNVANHPSNLQFAQSGAHPTIPTPINQELSKVSTYLKGKPNRQLMLTGYYTNKEQNKTNYANLGIARAESLKQKLVGLGVPAKQLSTKGILKNDLTFDNKNQLTGGIDFAFQPLADDVPATVNANLPPVVVQASRVIDGSQPLEFRGTQPIIPNAVKQSFKQMPPYFKQNADKELEITGKYKENEPKPNTHPNMGVARAEAIKKELVDLGVATEQISTKGIAEPTLTTTNGKTNKAIVFDVKDRKPMDKEVAETLTIKSFNVYFNLNSADFNRDRKTSEYFDNVRRYLVENPTKKILVEGHTDASGSVASNKILSDRRAKAVKDHFIQLGVKASQIETVGKGEIGATANYGAGGVKSERRSEIILR